MEHLNSMISTIHHLGKVPNFLTTINNYSNKDQGKKRRHKQTYGQTQSKAGQAT